MSGKTCIKPLAVVISGEKNRVEWESMMEKEECMPFWVAFAMLDFKRMRVFMYYLYRFYSTQKAFSLGAGG